jgi:hypothetical protein
MPLKTQATYFRFSAMFLQDPIFAATKNRVTLARIIHELTRRSRKGLEVIELWLSCPIRPGMVQKRVQKGDRFKKVTATFCAKHPSGRSGKRWLSPF